MIGLYSFLLIIYYFIYGYENVMGSNIVNLNNILKDKKTTFLHFSNRLKRLF